MGFLLSCCCVHIIIWMQHMNVIKAYTEKARRELDNNDAYSLEKILEATPQKTQLYGYSPPISQVRRTKHVGNCWRSKEKIISNVLFWTLAHWCTSVGQPVKTYISGAFNKFSDFFVQAFKIVVDSWKFSKLLLYILWDDWPIFF